MSGYRPGNCVTLLRCGAEYFPALEAAIDAAASDVYLETYIFADDASGRRIAAALVRAVRRGLRARVVADGFGSRYFMGRLLDDIRGEGVEVAIYRPEPRWFNFSRHRLRRLHRKLAVIDAATAFVGGINILDDLNGLDKPPPRLDFAVRVEGPLLADIVAAADRLWLLLLWSGFRRREPRGRPPRALPAPRAEPCGAFLAAFECRDNFRNRRDIERGYLDAIAEAREDILIANAYFFPGGEFRAALLAAAARGVRVRLLLQGRVEYFLAHYAQRALYGMLLAGGIEIIEYHDSFLHAKVAVIDRQWSTVGSSNIDPFSLLLAREANVFVRDGSFAQQLRDSLEHAVANGSRQVESVRWSRRSLLDRALTLIAYSVARRLLGLIGHADI
ncbi:MAG: cardiolipin synthase ClsB [Betaproteobacteria bacterium]|nr:cardiolipin synthase ClsB [Betaproteobacteria bacterium]